MSEMSETQSFLSQPEQRDEIASELEQRQREQFIIFLRWFGWADLLMVVMIVVMGLVGKDPLLHVVAGVTLLLYPAAILSMRLARAGQLKMGVYVMSSALYGIFVFFSLLTAGSLPALFLAGIIPVLTIGLFVSPEGVLRMTFVATLSVILCMLLERWSPFVKIDTSTAVPFIMPLIVLLIGYLIYLYGRNLGRSLEASQSRAVDLERSQVELTERTRDLQETTADLSFRRQELEVSNVRLEEARRRQEAINRELQEANERAHRRAAQLQAVAKVGQAIAGLRDRERLLPRVTELIGQHFGFYHVGLFLVDEAGRYAVLRAASSEGGQRMLARNHKLAVGEQGTVGYVTATGEPRIALDVDAEATHLANPDLPEARSEIALPLQIGGQTIGALDVQSVEAEAFDDESVAVLSTLADQVAIAIENARLFQQSQEALAEAKEVQRRYLQGEWEEFLRRRPDLQFEYTLAGIPSALDVELPTTRQAVTQGELVAASNLAGGDGDETVARAALSVPIKLRGQVIGVLDLHEADEARLWTEHEIALAEAVAEQLALTLESARLFEQTQARARREALTRQITDRIRDAVDVDAMLKTAIQELGQALGAPRVYVRLATDAGGDGE
jgi:GAF domain-containing protein